MLRLTRALQCKIVPRAVTATESTSLWLYEKLVSSHLTPSEAASIANKLIPYLVKQDALTVAQKYRILQTLTARAVRHEEILHKCIWGILKADLNVPGADASYRRFLAICTASTFSIMVRSGFRNDHQMTALALGRCTELAPIMPLTAVEQVYMALAGMGQDYFSLTSVALYESEVSADFTAKDPLLASGQKERTLGEIANQPNLIDVLCAELEGCLAELSAGRLQLPSSTMEEPQDGHVLRSTNSRLHLVELLGSIAQSFAAVGITSPAALESLEKLFGLALQPLASRWGRIQWDDQVTVAACLVAALRNVCCTQVRVFDPMNYRGSSHELEDARKALAEALTWYLCRLSNLDRILRHSPALVLSARSLFEKTPDLATVSPALWDRVRSVRVARKHVVAAKSAGRPRSPRLGGRLFDRSLAVKVKPITQDLSEAERFVPPQFKTWNSPAHSRLGGHRPVSGSGGKVRKFGARRISKNYIKNQRKRFAQDS